jgi:AbrB family looped-hinge helix DNA binding protein
MSSQESAVVTPKGQVVIPARLRRRLGIRGGTRLFFREQGTGLIVQPLTDAYIRSLRGSLKSKGKRSMLETLYEMRRQDRTR